MAATNRGVWLPLLADMAHALVEHGVDVVVGEGVVDVAAVASKFDEARLLENAQLMRNGALRGFGGFGDVRDAELAAHEGVKDFDARGVTEDFEEVGKVVEQLLVGHVFGRLAGRVNDGLVTHSSISFHMNMRSDTCYI